MRSAIFDLDGTLADTAADLLAAANHAFEIAGLGRPLTAADAATAGFGSRAMLKRGADHLGLSFEEADYLRHVPVLLAHYAEFIAEESRLFPGVPEALGALRGAGWRIGICTNKPIGLTERLLAALKARDLFDAVVGADSLPVKKPDPAPLFHAIALAGGRKDRAVMIGDTITDRKTARAAGIPVILTTLGPEGDLVRAMEPEAVMTGYHELAELLAQLCPAR